MINLLDQLQILLSQNKDLIIDGKLAKNKIIELALQLDPSLLKLLLKNTHIKRQFFTDVDGILVFDKIKFQKFVSNKEFLPDSFTAFKNKIGLTVDDEFISSSKDVVLSWPYKDCVLEGGQKKDDEKRDEVFWNEILSSAQINRLLSPKVLSSFHLFDSNGKHPLENIPENSNLIIKGNNLLSLACLRTKYFQKVDVIYIDPPFNPESKSNTFCYNNSFNHSTWLTFIKNRLDISKDLLSPSGVLIVAIDDNEQANLGVMLHELFPDHETHCITIVHNPRGVQGSNFSYTHEYAFFVIPKGKKSIGERKINDEDIYWSNLRNWGGESLREDARNCFYPVIIKDEQIIGFGDVLPPEQHPTSQTEKKGDRYFIYPIDVNGVEHKWRYARNSVEEIEKYLRLKKTKSGYEVEIGKDFGTYKTVWIDPKYDANEYGTKIVKSLVPDCKFDFPKSLYNVYDCLYSVISQNKHAIVLDYFGGSGTTAHALLKINAEDGGDRKFILCEQMDYVDSVTVPRVNKVIEDIHGGNFIYCELMKWNDTYMQNILNAKTQNDLLEAWALIKQKADLSYRINKMSLNQTDKFFADLSFSDQQQFLIDILDKNEMYVNLSEIDDSSYHISEKDKLLNHQFYGLSS